MDGDHSVSRPGERAVGALIRRPMEIGVRGFGRVRAGKHPHWTAAVGVHRSDPRRATRSRGLDPSPVPGPRGRKSLRNKTVQDCLVAPAAPDPSSRRVTLPPPPCGHEVTIQWLFIAMAVVPAFGTVVPSPFNHGASARSLKVPDPAPRRAAPRPFRATTPARPVPCTAVGRTTPTGVTSDEHHDAHASAAGVLRFLQPLGSARGAVLRRGRCHGALPWV